MSDLFDLFKEALIYPISNLIVLLTLGAMLTISNLPSVLANYDIFLDSASVYLAFGIIALGVSIVLSGYSLSVIRDAISFNVSVPPVNLLENFVDGLKAWALQIIYAIIPIIVVSIVFFFGGAFGSIVNILNYLGQGELVLENATSIINFVGSIPSEYISSFFTGLTITVIVAIILFLIFELLYEIGLCRLAKYDSIKEGINIREIWEDIKTIGIGTYILWYILFIIIIFLLSIVIGIISAIPYLGIILSNLICAPFIALFGSRALGLLYLKTQSI